MTKVLSAKEVMELCGISTTSKTTYAIKKNGRFVKDFSDGAEFTSNPDWVEKYSSKEAALVAARDYGRAHGKGYHVVELY